MFNQSEAKPNQYCLIGKSAFVNHKCDSELCVYNVNHNIHMWKFNFVSKHTIWRIYSSWAYARGCRRYNSFFPRIFIISGAGKNRENCRKSSTLTKKSAKLRTFFPIFKLMTTIFSVINFVWCGKMSPIFAQNVSSIFV